MKDNVVSWFEIPAADMARAKAFYSTVFKYQMIDYPMGDLMMAVFPFVTGGQNSSGCLIKGDMTAPSSAGTMVYFSTDEISDELSRVESSGGKILMPKTAIGENGHIAVCMDTEGNRFGMHSPK